jgi:two-component system NtrC family sensor kinase
VLEAVEHGFTELKEKGDKSVESLLKAKDGIRIPVEIRSFSIYDDEGNFIRTFSILRDMRKIKELQASLVHAGRLAAIGELASGVAHDINNPLTVILLSNEMMLNEIKRSSAGAPPSMERLENMLKDIQKASRSIQKLADHLRNFSRGMAEKREFIDLYTSISDALFITKNKIVSAGVEVINNVTKGENYISGCSNHMEQVFVNLVGNACDAMTDRPKRQLTISIEPAKMEAAECWKCNVTDTGIGIAKEIKDEVFQSFFTTKPKGKGTGLGLSISRGIIRDHKGDIVFTSDDKGTTFSVLLPKVDIKGC